MRGDSPRKGAKEEQSALGVFAWLVCVQAGARVDEWQSVIRNVTY